MAGYWEKQAEMFKGEVGALGRQGLNDARNLLMGDLSGEKTPGTLGYPTSQEVTDSFGGTYEQRMEQAKEGHAKEEHAGKEEQREAKGKSKGREMGD